jgi:hypothetical protein
MAAFRNYLNRSTKQKKLVVIEAHLQTYNFQNKLEAQWASILWEGLIHFELSQSV